MKLLVLIFCASFGLLFLPETLPAADVQPSKKPNILFILVDDYGIKDVGVEGSTFYETPHIDALARGGMRFTQGYAACPVCSPSRASIMLGKYPAAAWHHRLYRRRGGRSLRQAAAGQTVAVPITSATCPPPTPRWPRR